MRAIYKIARLELINLFYSPVAWLLLVFWVFMVGVAFADGIEALARTQELGVRGWILAISEKLFYSGRGAIWDTAKLYLYFLMPLLTMGLISQEFNQGSMKLLFSAPITSRHIVLGKFLGVMFYGLLMMGTLLVYVGVGWVSIENFEWAAVLTGLLGIYLLFALYAAIGLFMSSLTTYQIVAAIGMFATLSLLRVMSNIGQEYEFVRDVTYWLSINDRAESFIRGMICSEDLLYFLILSGMFLSFAYLKIQLKRESHTFTGKAGRYLTVFALAAILGYVTSLPQARVYHDATRTKNNTLTEASQNIVSRLDGGVTITTYINLFSNIYRIAPRGVKADINRYKNYIRFKPETRMKYVFYYNVDTTTEAFKKRYPEKTLLEAAQQEAKLQDVKLSKYLSPDKLKERIDLSDEEYRFVSLIERENGEKTFLRVYNDALRVPSETEISAALKRIGMKLPKVGFVADRGARSITGDRNRDHSYMVSEITYREALINQGFDPMEIKLEGDGKSLNDIDILVISEPQEAFSEAELYVLKRYIDEGKNIMLLGKPKTNSFLEPLMDLFGLRFQPGVLCQHPVNKNYEFPANLIFCRPTSESIEFSRYYKALYIYFPHYVITMPGASAIEVAEERGFKITPLVTSLDSLSWNEVETIDFINDTARINPKAGEVAERKVTVVALERNRNGKEQRIIVMGDADAISMGELATSRRKILTSNKTLIDGSFNWLSYDELPVNTTRPAPVDNKIFLTMSTAANLKFILKWIFPALILVGGVIILIRRRGK